MFFVFDGDFMSNPELIRKAARGRDVHLVGCLSFNKSAEKLKQMGEPALVDIERFLATELSTAGISMHDIESKEKWLDPYSVLHVYFEAAARSAKIDPGAFLLSLHGWLREEAMRVVFVIWGPSQGRQSKRLPPRLSWAVDRLAWAGSERERDFAKRLTQYQRKVAKRRGRAPISSH